MSDTPADPGQATEEALAIAYVQDYFFPPLPRAYGPWLVQLAEMARQGADPEVLVPIPADVVAAGQLPTGARRLDATADPVITLREALTDLGRGDLLGQPDPGKGEGEGPEFIKPETALALANTADAAYWGQAYDPDEVHDLATALTLGNWQINDENPIRVDQQGRVVSGLNQLLAVVAANIAAPAFITYDYDTATRPLTWRGPAGAEGTHHHD